MKEIESLLFSLSAAPTVAAAFVRSIPATALGVRRRPGAWTVEEHISHLAQVQGMLLRRLERFKQEERPVITPYQPVAPGEEAPREKLLGIDEALEELSYRRGRQIAVAESVPDELWDREGEHPEYSRYTARILLRHILMHDYWHLYRVEELWLARDEFVTDCY